MKKSSILWTFIMLMLAVGMNSCSGNVDNSEESGLLKGEDIELILSNLDKNTTYPVSNAVCGTDYKSPFFKCQIDDAPGLSSLCIYYNKSENKNNFFLEDIKVGDILDLDDFMAELFYPMEGFGYNRHTFVATSGKILVIDKKGEGKSLTFTLQISNLRFTETSRIESGARSLPHPYNVNGIIMFEYTE